MLQTNYVSEKRRNNNNNNIQMYKHSLLMMSVTGYIDQIKVYLSTEVLGSIYIHLVYNPGIVFDFWYLKKTCSTTSCTRERKNKINNKK